MFISMSALSSIDSDRHFDGQNYSFRVEGQEPWPDDGSISILQGGRNGIVIRRDGSSYRTNFVEVFTDETFIRGEGATIEEAEKDAFKKYQTYLRCSSHEWEARGYTNGGGFCKKCNTFKSAVITHEVLKAYCHKCNLPTFWSVNKNKETGEVIYGCKTHPVSSY